MDQVYPGGDRSLPKDDWRALLSRSVTSAEGLAGALPAYRNQAAAVIERYPVRINPYYLSLIRHPGDPCWRQAVPDVLELENSAGAPDPLCENRQSPVPAVIHRYPDRVVFLITNRCAMYCRHCMRKRQVGAVDGNVDAESVQAGIDYVRNHTAVRDVILSGGDPLMLADDELAPILKALRAIPHVSILRIHSRMPCTLPQRITQPLVDLLRGAAPLYLNTQFNHPVEITAEAEQACSLLVDSGIPVGCQTVLLKGVNDTPAVMAELLRKLVAIRVKPYYLHHPDLVRGTAHFRPPVKAGLAIMEALRGHVSGLCLPHYMIDLPGGGGKVPLLPNRVREGEDGTLLVRNYEGRILAYPG